MDITLSNILYRLKYFSKEHITELHIRWVEPIGVTMLKSYVEACDIDISTIKWRYARYMINTPNLVGETYTSIESVSDRNHIDDIQNDLSKTIMKNFLELKKNDQQDIKSYFQYMISEIMNNVADHSQSIGYTMAQYYPDKKKIQVAISDFGVGFLHNLSKKYPELTTDKAAIKKAIEKGVTASNNYLYNGTQRNVGFGLFALVEIIKELKGKVVIISNGGALQLSNGVITEKDISPAWKGTVVAFEFSQDNIEYSYEEMMNICRLEDKGDDEEDFFV